MLNVFLPISDVNDMVSALPIISPKFISFNSVSRFLILLPESMICFSSPFAEGLQISISPFSSKRKSGLGFTVTKSVRSFSLCSSRSSFSCSCFCFKGMNIFFALAYRTINTKSVRVITNNMGFDALKKISIIF